MSRVASGRTPPLERWASHATTAIVGATGIALFVFRSVLEPPADDPFAVVSHPLEPPALWLHVVVAPLSVLAIGMLLRSHFIPRLMEEEFRRSRRSGIAIAATALPMILSGSLLQVTISEGWRKLWLVTHLVTGAAWILGWLAHLVSARRKAPAVGRAS